LERTDIRTQERIKKENRRYTEKNETDFQPGKRARRIITFHYRGAVKPSYTFPVRKIQLSAQASIGYFLYADTDSGGA